MENKSTEQLDVRANSPVPTTWWRINPKLILLKGHFFFSFGAQAAVIPPLVLYSQQLGLSLSMVGALFATLPFIQCVAKATGSAVADKFQIHKSVFLFGLVVMAAATFSLNFIPKVNVNLPKPVLLFDSTVVEVTCHTNPPSLQLQLVACDSHIMKYTAVNESKNTILRPLPALCNVTCSDEETSKIRILFCGDLDDPGCSEPETSNNGSTIFSSKESKPIIIHAKMETGNTTSRRFDNCTWYDISNISLLESQFRPRNKTVRRCPFHQRGTFTMSCSAKCYSSGNETSDVTEHVSSTTQITWLWLGCIMNLSMFGVVLSIADATLVSSLGENQGDFGKTRLFASVGWGLISPIAAFVIEHFSEGLEIKNYAPGFYFFFALTLCNLAIAVPMKVSTNEFRPAKLLKEVIATFKQPPVLVFLLAVFFEGVATGVLWTFAIVYANELNSNAVVIGLTFAVECFVSEIPLFWVSGWIVNKLGHATSLSCALLFTGLKSLFYSVISDAWYMLLIALIHGVTYAMLYASAATYAKRVAPPGACATMQGIFQGVFEGIGVGVGNFLGGITYDYYGGQVTFRIFGFFMIGISALYQLFTYVTSRRNSGKYFLEKSVT